MTTQIASDGTLTKVCEWCGERFAPRVKKERIDWRVFCKKPECKRARKRLSKQVERERKAGV